MSFRKSLFAVSAIYHRKNWSEKLRAVWRRLDHSAIFLLIAGTYTPFTLVTLRGAWGWTLFTIVWLLGCAGWAIQVLWRL